MERGETSSLNAGAEGNIGRGRGLKLKVEEVARGLTPGMDKERRGTDVAEVARGLTPGLDKERRGTGVAEVARGLTPGMDKEKRGTGVAEVDIVGASCPLRSSFLEETGCSRTPRQDPVLSRGGSGELEGGVDRRGREGFVGFVKGLNLRER